MMIPNFLEDIADRIKPALGEATTTMCAYAERIISNLESIVDAVQADEMLNVRKFPYVTLAPGNQTIEVVQVPTDQDWLLQAVTIDASAATTIRMVDGATGSITRFGATIAAAGVTTFGGQGIVIPGGTVLTLTNTAGTSIVFMQFRFERRGAKYRATNAGAINQPTDRNDSRTEAAETGRHAGTSRFPGENVRGERHKERVF